MDGQVSGLGTVHPILTLSFVSTWILPLHVVSSTLKRKSSSSVMDGLQRRRRRRSKRISITATLCSHHQSFEVIRLSLTLTSRNIHFFCLYRPPPSRNNQLTDSSFFSDFLFLLGQCNTLSSKSIILGDLNVHFDIPTNPLVLKILSSCHFTY